MSDVAASAVPPDPTTSRMFPVIHYVTYVGIIAHAGFIGLFYWLHIPVMALFNVFSVAVWIAARVANQRAMPRLAALLLSAEVVAHAILAVCILEAERMRFDRSGRSFGIIIGDVDGFKQLNDSLGHECGDHALRELAAVLRSVLRAQDAVARWGGEELLFLLPETDAAGAQVVAEKLRQAVERAALLYGGKPLTLTMTFGVAAFSRQKSVDDGVRIADEALYAGKDAGKNRVVVA